MDQYTTQGQKNTPRRRNGTGGPAVTNAASVTEEQLIPGIHNDPMGTCIIPKLSWCDIRRMFSVNSSWKRAISSHQIYDIRVRTRSTETLAVVLINKNPYPKLALSLYSVGDKCWRELPPIPGLPHGFPLNCQCVSLDGKLYVLGGDFSEEQLWDAEVYVLDLAGRGLWKTLASMSIGRRLFAAAVKNGRIYVFGGSELRLDCLVIDSFLHDNTPAPKLDSCEEYDPKVDSWSPRSSMESVRFDHSVTAMGEELLLHSGTIVSHFGQAWVAHRANGQLYDPIKNTWRVMEDFMKNSPSEAIFSVGGRLLALTNKAIHVFDTGRKAWAILQTCSPPISEGVTVQVGYHVPLAVGDELLIKARPRFSDRSRPDGVQLFHSKGFNKAKEILVWEAVSFPHPSGEQSPSLGYCELLCSIEL